MTERRAPDDPTPRIVAGQDDGIRLDKWVAAQLDVSRRSARMLISAGRVRIGGKIVRILTRPLKAGARISIDSSNSRPLAGDGEGTHGSRAGSHAPEAPPASPGQRGDRRRSHNELCILHIDPYVVVVDKPAGLLSETDRVGSPSLQTVLPGQLHRRGEPATELYLVHRLDAGTSGVIVLARRRSAVRRLSAVFRDGGAKKTYLALCTGRFAAACTVDQPIGRMRGVKHGIKTDGKPAMTRFAPVAAGDQFSLVRAEPHSGRTHQIRVHMAHLGHPLLGDGLYGGPRYVRPTPNQAAIPVHRAMLHAARLQLPHPNGRGELDVQAPLPSDFNLLRAALGLCAQNEPACGDPPQGRG